MWHFTKNGEITNGNVSIAFDKLASLISGVNSNSYIVKPNLLGETLADNDLVYISQSDGLYYKAFKNTTVTESQNVVGVYKLVGSDHTIYIGGNITNFSTGLVPGYTYYLSDVPGVATNDVLSNTVKIGRAISNTDILLDISGDVNIGIWAGYDTRIINGQNIEGVGLTDPDGLMTLAFNKVAYDVTVPSGIQFVDVNGTTVKVDVATEYYGDTFTMTVGTTIYAGVFASNEDFNNPTTTTLISGTPSNTNNTTTGGTTGGTTTGGTTGGTTTGATTTGGTTTGGTTGGATTGGTTTGGTTTGGTTTGGTTGGATTGGATSTVTNAYGVTLTGTQSSDGISLTDPNSGSDITISFDAVTYDATVPANVMFASINGATIKLDFQSEYTNKPIDAISGGVRYTGNIVLNESYTSPTVLTQV